MVVAPILPPQLLGVPDDSQSQYDRNRPAIAHPSAYSKHGAALFERSFTVNGVSYVPLAHNGPGLPCASCDRPERKPLVIASPGCCNWIGEEFPDVNTDLSGVYSPLELRITIALLEYPISFGSSQHCQAHDGRLPGQLRLTVLSNSPKGWDETHIF